MRRKTQPIPPGLWGKRQTLLEEGEADHGGASWGRISNGKGPCLWTKEIHNRMARGCVSWQVFGELRLFVHGCKVRC